MQDREECDSRALETLAEELASRTTSRMEETSEVPSTSKMADMDKMMREFEWYQQQLMEQDL